MSNDIYIRDYSARILLLLLLLLLLLSYPIPPPPPPTPPPRRLSLLNARRERALIRRLPKQRRELRLLAKCRGLGARIIHTHTHTHTQIYIYIYPDPSRQLEIRADNAYRVFADTRNF